MRERTRHAWCGSGSPFESGYVLYGLAMIVLLALPLKQTVLGVTNRLSVRKIKRGAKVMVKSLSRGSYFATGGFLAQTWRDGRRRAVGQLANAGQRPGVGPRPRPWASLPSK